MFKDYLKLIIFAVFNFILIDCTESNSWKLANDNSTFGSSFKVAILFPEKIDKTGWSNSNFINLNNTFQSIYQAWNPRYQVMCSLTWGNWYKNGYQGLKLIETKLDAEIAYRENLADIRVEN